MTSTTPPDDTADVLRTPPSADHPGVIMRPPLLFAGTFIIGVIIDLVAPLALFEDAVRWVAAAVAVVLGLVLAAGGMTLFHRAGTNVQTHMPSTAVVTTGLYRFSRNPIYLGLAALYVGLAFAANSGWALILLFPLMVVMRHGVVAREERYLEARRSGSTRKTCYPVSTHTEPIQTLYCSRQVTSLR